MPKSTMYHYLQLLELTQQRTANRLNAGLPIKWSDKSFKENDIFSAEKVQLSDNLQKGFSL